MVDIGTLVERFIGMVETSVNTVLFPILLCRVIKKDGRTTHRRKLFRTFLMHKICFVILV